MLNSESCDGPGWALDGLLSRKLDQVTQSLPPDLADREDVESLKQTARDFATLFYGELVKQMHKSVREDGEEGEEGEEGDEGGVIREGADDFFTMFLPQALAETTGDTLTRYVQEQLQSRYGDRLDESA